MSRAGIRAAIFVMLAVVGTGAAARDLTPDIHRHVLPNGLEVYLLEDRSAPLFTFQYWVKVGSGDEWEGNPGVTGLSHFFEHLMFRGTERFPKYFDEVSSRGGKVNAFTWLDVTVYWEKLHKQALEHVLDIESDRIRNMRVDFLSVEPEREVVKSERLLRVENSPSGALNEAVGATLFQHHSYHWPTVGWMRDLSAISIAEAQRYHSRFYVPNNAFIVLVGDFDAKAAFAQIRKAFGDFERRPLQRTERQQEPPQTAERRIYVEKPTGAGLFNVSYRCPAGSAPDFVALDVARQLLAGGKTARLQSALIHTPDPLAKDLSSFMFPFVDPGVLQIEVQMLPGKANRLAEERLTAEVERLASEPVSPDELERAVAQLRADIVRGMATTNSRATMIGFSVRATGDPTLPWKRLRQYGEVTPADVQRVGRKWLGARRRVVGHALDPSELVTLTGAFLADHPSTTAGLDALVGDALAYAVDSEAHRRESATLAEERRALVLLGERAERAREQAPNDRVRQMIETYLRDGEKGLTKREAMAARRAEALATRAAELGKRHQALLERLGAVEQTARGAEARRIRWAARLLGARGVGGPSAAPEDDVGLGEWALSGLCMQHFGGVRARGIAQALARRASEGGTLQAIREFAHKAQSLGAGRM